MLRMITLATVLTFSLGSSGVASGVDALEPMVVEHRAGLRLDLYEPPATGANGDQRPVVVLVHDCCGDRRDLSGLARALARRGAIVGNADVSGLDAGGGWPTTYHDVVCAVAWAHATAAERSHVDDVVILGWGSGALVAGAVTLGWETIAAGVDGCTERIPTAAPGTVIAVGGHFGWRELPPPPDVTGAARWFGAEPADDPDAWTHGSAAWWTGRPAPTSGPRRFLLIDAAGSPATEAFGEALHAAAVDAETVILPTGSHGELVQVRGVVGEVVLSLIVDRLGLLPS